MDLISCRLCSFICYKFKCLFDNNGQTSEVYKVAVKYFDSSLLDAVTESSLRVICLECWQHISDFHSFQQWILNAQAQQEDLKFIKNEEMQIEQISRSDITALNIDNTTTKSIKSDESISGSIDILGNKKDSVCYSEVIEEYECIKCKEVFQNYVALDAHFQLFHSNNISNTKLEFAERQVEKETSTTLHSKSDENTFKCETCGASFSQYGSLRRHVRKKHASQPLLKWICKYCNKVFKNRLYLEKHKNKLHNCQNSDNSEIQEKQISDYEEHQITTDSESEDGKIYKRRKTRNNNQNYSVNIESSKTKNDQQFNSKNTELDLSFETSGAEINNDSQIHMPALDIVDIKSEISTDIESDSETNISEFNINEFSSDVDDSDDFLSNRKYDLKCPRCRHHFKNYFLLSEHFSLKHPDERCYINCCQMTLYDRQSIVEHLQFHENPNAFECNECGKCFTNKKGLSSHKQQVHSDKRSSYHLHLCYCKKSQERSAKKISEGEQMKYDTVICCQRKKKILEDDALIAKWKKKLTCEICKATFPYYSLMRAHFYHEHPGEKCNISCCQRKMSRVSDALEHIRFHLNPHAYRCKVCNIDFSAKNTLAKHMRNTHADSAPKHKWACDECDKTFEIRQILTRHKNVFHSKRA